MGKIYRLGITGHPLGHTLSPVMHRCAAAHLGLELTYDPFDVTPAELPRFMEGLRSSGLDGLNVTVPHKLAVMAHMDETSEEAERIGAVNTIVIAQGRLAGRNTDAYGFLTSLRENGGIDPDGKKSLILGAGGAARAVAWAMLSAGAVVTIANRTEDKARRIAADFAGVGAPISVIGLESEDIGAMVRESDIVINSTSLGMGGKDADGLRRAQSGLRKDQLAVDIVYRPLDTPFLAAAREAGAATLDGLWMLIHQGAQAFTLWTGRPFPVALARMALEKELGAG